MQTIYKIRPPLLFLLCFFAPCFDAFFLSLLTLLAEALARGD